MNRHQVLTGAANAGDHCYSVGSVEGVPFTAYASGCNIVILASDFQRVQIIPGIAHGNVQVGCLDCSTDVGKIAAAYGKEVCIFEPTPLIGQVSSHKLDYQWVQTATISTEYHAQVLSWNLSGSRLLTGGECIQLWQLCLPYAGEDTIEEEPSTVQIVLEDGTPIDKAEQYKWDCIWKCKTSQSVAFLKFSPDGTLFASAGSTDRLVKIWFSSKVAGFAHSVPTNGSKYTFVYIAHPRAVTGLSWRKTSKFMPRDSVANMLVTSCRDNICRIWLQTLVPEDGLVNFQQIEALANETPRAQTQRHRRKIMQRLKHMKSVNQYKRRQATQYAEDTDETIPTLPSTYSVHDFHSFSLQGSGITPGLHFHLAASINAETDIPLVPRLNGGTSSKEPNFVVHWLNNKEMEFTHAAEHLLQEVSYRALNIDEKDNALEQTQDSEDRDSNPSIKVLTDLRKKKTSVLESQENVDEEMYSKHGSSSASSSTSIATDTSNSQAQNHSADFLDRKIEMLLRDWHRSPDLLFSVYPADGSFLVWLVDWLDEYYPSSFRQAQVSFASRIPSAIPLGDASTMSHHLYLYSPHAGLDLRLAISSSFLNKKYDVGETTNSVPPASRSSHSSRCAHSTSTPIVCMLSKHHNGSLNLWHMTFGENSHYTQVLSIAHSTRVCGHRFRINDISCHPVLPLLLTTSHHNLPIHNNSSTSSPNPSIPSSPCCPGPTQVGLQAGFCSELILWKVDPVGPLSKSGGITELARINSPEMAAFANVAWIPTLLPSTTQGTISNSPSACFVASDGHQLRIYQAVIDARSLLTEISLASREKHTQDLSASSSSSSDLGYRHGTLKDAFKIVSEQSTSRPGCIIELDVISDATHDWQNTLLLYVYQEQLVTSRPPVKSSTAEEQSIGLVQPDLQAIVDLRHSPNFEEPFYLAVLEKQEESAMMHMWRIVIASQVFANDHDQGFAFVPDSHLVQDSDHSNHSSRSQTPELNHDPSNPMFHVSPLHVTTTKVCSQILPLAPDVEIVHAAPAAGHLSSSNIYPACYAPYLICTACSDYYVRFWKCEYINGEDKVDHTDNFNWVEWEMMLNKTSSAVQVFGQPLYVSCAYSGRMACAYKHGHSFTKHGTEEHSSARYVNISVSIFECESTGGSEWILEDTINMRNVSLPEPNINSLFNLDTLYNTSQKNKRTVEVLMQKLSTDESVKEQGYPLQRLLSVPSYTTLQSLRQSIIEQGNQCILTPKSLVQLDWASAEDGSHILTVAIGSKILLFAPVSNDIAQANVQAMKASKSASRPLLKQASSMVLPLSCTEDIRWMRIRTTYLKTADSLPPLPMQCSWVRHGILVVGMDNEMHIYSQWRNRDSDKEEPKSEAGKDDMITDGRKLTEQELISKAQESSQLRLPAPSGTLSRSTSSTILNIASETKQNKSTLHSLTNKAAPQRDSLSSIGPMPDLGLFEACRLACPILPQYHPKQLMELLGFGKLRRVKAILSHLVRCLSGTDNVKVPDTVNADTDRETGGRSWSRTRAMSLAAGSSPLQHSPMDPTGSLTLFPEEVTLDYVEIQSIPPLPLFTLLSADCETSHVVTAQTQEGEAGNQDYSDLFETGASAEDNLDEILHDKIRLSGSRERPSFSCTEPRLMLTHFGMRQANLLTKFLTHSHLPGLSSLDQMHLLALADTVASFNAALSDRLGADIVIPKEQAKSQMGGLNVQVTTDSLDDCGLRFLLAMRHYNYLLRCLPLAQRAQLQSQGLGSQSLVWAFHSETQEELLQLVPCVQRGNPKWSELKELGVGWWVRSNTLLRKLIEKVAKAAFQARNDPLDAALFYLAMKKKTLVWGLFRSVHDQKMTAFFHNNFSEDRWRKSALKNAFALMGKQRFEHAAAFFLLAGSLADAVDVCLNNLDDLQLAMVIIRLYESELEADIPILQKLLFEEVLGCEKDGSNYIPSRAHPDPFLRCMARWMMKDYCGSLTTLLQTDVGYSHPKAVEAEMNQSDGNSANPSVFNFYLFLRMHPLVVRRQKAKVSKPTLKHTGKAHTVAETDDVPYEDTITPLERRLFFTTAHAHFRAGCPALALEVLSRLPCRVATDGPMSPDDAVFDFANVANGEDISISTGTLLQQEGNAKSATADSFDWGAPASSNATADFDWGAPVATSFADEPLELNLEESDSSSEEGIEMKTVNTAIENDTVASDAKPETQLDIMAQQLKFIACLKIMMEELSTLATGFEVDGGQLRYQLYIWLERSVAALKDLCNYGCGGAQDIVSTEVDDIAMGGSGKFSPRATMTAADGSADAHHERHPSLHEILLADKLDFEDKLQRATWRKLWLKANEALLRTLLSYCSLHGCLGGGLAAVRIELILLLHELQQERSQQQLLSPLPFPTTLPLLAASVACQKTVVADPIRHLQSLTHDILLTIIDMREPPVVTGSTYSCFLILRDLSTSLSACIYESLCDSDTFVIKQGGPQGLCMELLISSGVVYQNSHLLAGHLRRQRHHSKEGEQIVTTLPNKWPGVQSLRALLAQDKDEDSPKLHTLLCEAFVSVYLSLLIHALSTCDCHVLYRLVGQNFTKDTFAVLFGGGAKMLLRTGSAVPSASATTTPPIGSAEKEGSMETSGGIFDSFSRQRIKLHMKLLGQLGQSSTQPSSIKEDKPTYREQFVPPQMSMVSLLMIKTQLPTEWHSLDYESNESLPSDEESDVEEGGPDDVFSDLHESLPAGSRGSRKKTASDSCGLDQLDPSSYTWGILRYSIVKLAHSHLIQFLSVAGIELAELPVTSPLLHATLKSVEQWLKHMKSYMDAFEGPPPNYIPGCYIENTKTGPAILKYKALLDLQNTPFRSNRRVTMPVKRLWNFLVRQELVQDIFIRYIFKRKPSHIHEIEQQQAVDAVTDNVPTLTEPIQIIHKDQDTVASFCLSKVMSGYVALATSKEIQEMNISVLLEPIPWLENEAEYDVMNLMRSPLSLPASEYLVVQHPLDKVSSGQSAVNSAYNSPTGSIPPPLGSQASRPSATVLTKHKLDGVRKLAAHPMMPVYLSGSQDGSVNLWEWCHSQHLSSPRPPGTFAKVTRILFNLQGNKFGVTDGDGNISLWQVGLSSVSKKPFFNAQCHSKFASDFAFVGSSSFIATSGYSVENKNVCLWDTLLPQRKALVHEFMCHEHGCSALVYAAQNQVLITAGKKGDICIFDVRQRQQRHKFVAHDSAIKCIALDPGEEFFATGSADGDIKVWGLNMHGKLHSFTGEHTKSTLFRNVTNGVSQMEIDESGRLFSCGADGSFKLRTLPERDVIVNSMM